MFELFSKHPTITEDEKRHQDYRTETAAFLEKMNDLYEPVFGERPFKLYMEIPAYYFHLTKYDLHRMSR